jgi:hypothetical protein
VNQPDLGGLRVSYGKRGPSPCPPGMMPAILIYAYIKGIFSTR